MARAGDVVGCAIVVLLLAWMSWEFLRAVAFS